MNKRDYYMNIEEKARKILEERFEPIELEDSSGFVKNEYRKHIEAFMRVDNLTAWGYRTASQLYQNSILIDDWFCGEVLLPLVGGKYIHTRTLKRNEPSEIMPPRFENALVAHSEGLSVPEPLAILNTKGGERKYVASFAGEQNIMRLLARKGLYLQSGEHQLYHAQLYREYWSMEGNMHEEWSRLPSLQRILKLSLSFDKVCVETINLINEVGVKLGSDLPPDWLLSLYFFLKENLIDIRYKNSAEREISELFEASKQLKDFEKSSSENRQIRSPEDSYRAGANLGIALNIASDKGFFLYEIAPRDIVIDYDLSVRFADTERMDWLRRPLTKDERKKQFALLKKEFPSYKKARGKKTNKFAYNRFMEEVERAYFSH